MLMNQSQIKFYLCSLNLQHKLHHNIFHGKSLLLIN